LTEYFLERYVYAPLGRQAPELRLSFIEAVRKDLSLEE
jgi:hypothetical protein